MLHNLSNDIHTKCEEQVWLTHSERRRCRCCKVTRHVTCVMFQRPMSTLLLESTNHSWLWQSRVESTADSTDINPLAVSYYSEYSIKAHFRRTG